MNAKRVDAASRVICASQKRKQTAAGIAADLEAACLLQSPEMAAEVAEMRISLQRLDEVATARGRELNRLLGRVAELEGGRVRVLREAADAIVADNDRKLWASKPGKHWAADLLRRLANEDPHDSPLHHDYALGHDLPEVTS